MSTTVLPQVRPATRPERLKPTSHRGGWFAALPPGRIVAIDVARFLALIGMVLAHTAVLVGGTGERNWVGHVVEGRASALFAILAGVSLALMTGGASPVTGPELRRRSLSLAIRAVLIFIIGLALAVHFTTVRLILPVYAVIFLLAIAFLRLRARTLFVIGGAWMLIGPAVLFVVNQRGFENPFLGDNLTFTTVAQHPLAALHSLVLSGTYPAVVWFAYVIIGVGVGRCDLRRWQPAAWLTGVGVALWGLAHGLSRFAPSLEPPASSPKFDSMVDKLASTGSSDGLGYAAMKQMKEQMTDPFDSPSSLLLTLPHSGSIGDVLSTVGTALFALGICLLVVRGGLRLWKVVAGAGAMTLTLYCVHVLIMGLPYQFVQAHPLRWNLGVLVAIGFVFGLLGRSGPLERAVTWLSTRASHFIVGAAPRRPVRRSPVSPPAALGPAASPQCHRAQSSSSAASAASGRSHI